MFIYKGDKKATCDLNQLEEMKKAGWSTKAPAVPTAEEVEEVKAKAEAEAKAKAEAEAKEKAKTEAKK